MAELLTEKHPLYNTAFFYGKGVFETIKIIDFKIINWEKHLIRLKKSCHFLKINFSAKWFNKKKILKYVPNSRIYRLNLYVTELKTYFKITPYTTPNKTLHLKMASFKRSNHPLYQHKTLNYLENILLKEEAQNKGCDDFIIISFEGYICETSIANIFWKKKNSIYTPSLDLPIIPGVIREDFIHQLKLKKFNVLPGKYKFRDLENSEQIWLTNSMMGVMPAIIKK